MDYQASKSCIKEIRNTKITKIRILIYGFLCFVCIGVHPMVMAQTTTNPLTIDVTITALVLQNPGVNPDTPPVSPGPVSMVDTFDVAIFKGLAYPRSTISLLKNGIVVAEIPANNDGTFDIRIRNLVPGTYSFGLRAQDKNGLQSKLLTFTIYVSSQVATIVQGIFIPPTFTSDKVEVKKGESVIFSGSGAPHAEIRLSFLSTFELLKRGSVNASGTWFYTLDSNELDFGDYDAKGRLLTASDTSPYSDILTFRVGSTTRFRPKLSLLSGFRKRCDLNDDGRVNLLDFSIMAFWYKRLTFPPKVDLNSDKHVNLTDLSILAYCWTG